MSYPVNRFHARALTLTRSDAVGMGNRRWVFVHPHHPDLCIKVARRDHIRRQLDQKGGLYRYLPTHWRDDNWLEARAYRQPCLAGDDPDIWLHLPRLYGWQATNLGPGLVFDYFQTGDGAPAPTLEQLVRQNGLTAGLENAVAALAAYIEETSLWMRHPGPPNIVLAADGRLKLIDCLGTYSLPLQKYLPAMRKRRIRRHIAYLETALGHLTA